MIEGMVIRNDSAAEQWISGMTEGGGPRWTWNLYEALIFADVRSAEIVARMVGARFWRIDHVRIETTKVRVPE